MSLSGHFRKEVLFAFAFFAFVLLLRCEKNARWRKNHTTSKRIKRAENPPSTLLDLFDSKHAGTCSSV